MNKGTMDDDQVTAYVDGELDAAGRAAFEDRLAQDAGLRAVVAREQRLRARLQDAFNPVLDEPVPQRLSDKLRSAPVISLAAARERRGWSWQHWGGMAASLVLGLVMGPRLLPDGEDSLAAQGALARALDGALSGQSSEGVTPGLSFVARGGGYCRSFTLGDAQAGLACREGDAWRLRQLMPAAPASGNTTYRMAGSAMPPALLESVDALREGEVLDVQAEKAALARGWQK